MERKAELEEEERERKLKAERAEHERRKRLEQARIERLLEAAAAFQQAGAIRKYVEAIRLTLSSNEACSPEELELWSQWALSEADRIDPAVGGAFLIAMRDEESAQDESFLRMNSLEMIGEFRSLRQALSGRLDAATLSLLIPGIPAQDHALRRSQRLCHNCETKPAFTVKTDFIDDVRLLILRNLLKAKNWPTNPAYMARPPF